MPVFTDEQAGISHERDAGEQVLPEFAYVYGLLVKEATVPFRNILLKIMNHDYIKGAVLWHCSEGKDRCGLTTAMVLEALGVDRQTIMEDYLKTNLVNLPKAAGIRDQLIVTRGKEFADNVYQAYIADERYLQAAWDAMGEHYITENLGIDKETINRFRAAVLE